MEANEANSVARLVLPMGSNPFLESAEREEAERLLTEMPDHDVGRALNALHAQGLFKQARRFALAAAHHRALLGTAKAPEFLLSVGPMLDGLRPKEVWDVASRSARCALTLKLHSGPSLALKALRQNAWAASFGESLDVHLHLRSLVRDVNVVILGETGTGKENVAMAIRAGTPVVEERLGRDQDLNAASVPEPLVESELFGHVKGAFSGASESRTGKIVAADGATLFLDELGSLAPATQPKLLRAVESNQVTPVGSNDTKWVDVRYLCATSKPIEEMVDDGRFSRDLYERLAGVVLYVPPLRERREDILPIGMRILEQAYQSKMSNVTPFVGRGVEVEQWLKRTADSYDWPGNVRELQNRIMRMVLGIQDDLTIPKSAKTASKSRAASELERLKHWFATDPELDGIKKCEASLDDVTRWYVRRVLESAGGNQTKAAKTLDIDRGTLTRHLRVPKPS